MSQERGLGEPAEGIDVIVRFHDMRRLHELDRALFSLFNQNFRPVRPIVVVQNLTLPQTQAVSSVVRRYDWKNQQTDPLILNVDGAPQMDLRSKLINIGFSQATYRFVAILDCDDYLYEHAYAQLISELLRSQAALAFGRIVIKYVRAFERSVYTVRTVRDMYRGTGLKDLVENNFCPVHSFVIDRDRVCGTDLYFEESMTRLEDYDFLLRLCTKYEFSFNLMLTAVGVYNWRVDGTNSIQAWEVDDEKAKTNVVEWDRSRLHIINLQDNVKSILGDRVR